MTTLKQISDYSQNELTLAKSKSTAISRYLNFLERTPQNVSQELRLLRHTAWLECALATLFNSSSAEDICRYWSAATDSITQKAWVASECHNENMALFALGKWGSNELNLSSDIDIIFVSDANPDAKMLKCAREFISLLSQQNEFGFCFRVDTDLKPGGRLSPLICSLKQFEDYYWSHGATWERLALVRLRPITGNKSVISATKDTADKFIFRKFIDFSLLEDLKHLRSQIHLNYPQQNEERINLKLAAGGIRDIELFIHALQVIHGGKQPSLRTTSTSTAGYELIRANRFAKEDMLFLINTYWYFRELENRTQAIDDQQTHEWTTNLGQNEFEKFKTLALRVESIVESLLGKPNVHALLPSSSVELESWLKNLGYSEHTIRERIPELLNLTALSSRTYLDEELRLKVIRKFIETLAELAIDSDLGIALLTDFIKSTRVKVSFFSLLLHEPRLIKELSILFGTSPYLGGVVAARPELLDSFLFREHVTPSKQLEFLLEQLAERRLLGEIISASQFLQTLNVDTLTNSLTITADEICSDLLSALKSEYGQSSLNIIALGKWGGRELGLRSDLDFIFLTDNPPNDVDQKIARRFLSRITESHRGGSIYEVDLRLRPSGKAGPIIVDRAALIEYLTNEAAPWERQSYLKSRTVLNNTQFENNIYQACVARALNEADYKELNRIRLELSPPAKDDLDIKYSPGGMVDIEFAIQVVLLQNQIVSDNSSLDSHFSSISEKQPELKTPILKLQKYYKFFRMAEQLYHLVNQHPGSVLKPSDPGVTRVARVLNLNPADLLLKIHENLSSAADTLKILDPRRTES